MYNVILLFTKSVYRGIVRFNPGTFDCVAGTLATTPYYSVQMPVHGYFPGT